MTIMRRSFLGVIVAFPFTVYKWWSRKGAEENTSLIVNLDPQYIKVVGLLFSCRNQSGREPADWKFWLRWQMAHNFPLVISMPCGNRREFASLAELPAFDTLCPCGDPRHWIVKYEYEGESRLIQMRDLAHEARDVAVGLKGKNRP